MRLKKSELAGILTRLHESDGWNLLSQYRDWRLAGRADLAADVAAKLRLHLSAIVAERTTDELQAIVEELYSDELDRLKRGMEPVPHVATDEQGAIEYFVHRLELPGHVRDRYAAIIKEKIAELSSACEPGDTVWICRSRYVGPMAGHEGLGIVRQGQVMKYETMVHF